MKCIERNSVLAMCSKEIVYLQCAENCSACFEIWSYKTILQSKFYQTFSKLVKKIKCVKKTKFCLLQFIAVFIVMF